MTAFDLCDHCQLQEIEDHAKTRGQVVTVLPGPLGTAVHVHREGEPPDEGNWVAWFITLSEHCSCTPE